MTLNSFLFEAGMQTHAGRVRQVNEDSAYVSPENGIWLIADGMGGHREGKLASSMIVDAARSVRKPVSAPELLSQFSEHILNANAQLFQMGGPEKSIIGSTVAAVLTFGRQFACVWAGDSRVYLIRGGAISQISKDHTEVQELVDQGSLTAEEARTWPRRNVITRAIGAGEDPGLEVVQGQLRDSDSFVICSDGLTGHVRDDEILREARLAPAQAACEALVGLALERGGKDNVSVIVLHVRLGDQTTVVQRA